MHLNQMITYLQEKIIQAHQEIKTDRASVSWRITKPIRDLSLLRRKFIQLMHLYQNYQCKYPGLRGYIHPLRQTVIVARKGGLNALRNSFARHRRAYEDTLTRINEFKLFEALQARALDTPLTILFDHNGGGGTNIYTSEIVNNIRNSGDSVLRIYPIDEGWVVQWVDNNNDMFFTSCIDKLFKALSISRGTNMIVNSLYGHPDLNVSIPNIIKLARTLKATLDIKIHDFNALCPSPHLLDFNGKYCGVPQNLDVCSGCLKKNHSWYHSWYPEKNKPINITEWRKPFQALLKAAETVTFFDSSSIEIVRQAFYLKNSKIRIIPHTTHYFKCDKPIDLNGPLHIGILGTLSKGKGSDVVNAIYEHIQAQNMQIPMTLAGSSYVDIPPGIMVHGNYEPNDLPIILSKQGVNIILMASIVPETFSYTISEAMKMGLPIVAFDIGAQGNRVKQYELGRVIQPDSSPEVILTTLQSTLKYAQELTK